MSARKKVAASKRSRVSLTWMSMGSRITYTDASSAKLSCQMIKLPTTTEVNEVQEALKSSSLEFKAVVKDPLPDALHVAGTVVFDVAGKGTTNVSQMHGGNNPPVAENSEAVRANGCDTDNHSYQHQKDAPRSSLMAQNSTAHTVEWEDSIDSMTADSPNHRDGARLPSPKIRVVSPLRTHEPKNVKRRRKIKKWSLEEEATLRMGVEMYGRGNWKVILNAHRDIFEDRTEVDLKDKWRNMMRSL